MKTIKTIVMFFALVPALFLVNLQAGNDGDKMEIRKTFEGIDSVKIRTMNGSCAIKKAEGREATVQLLYEGDSDQFKPYVEKEGSTLLVMDRAGSCGEDSVCTITVPTKTDVEFTSVSGNFSIAGITADIEARTVSGDIKAADCSGTMQFNTTSGEFTLENLIGQIDLRGTSSNMKISNLSGELEVKTSSGDIEIEKAEGKLSLKMASGDIEMKGVKGEFKVQSASGDVDLTDITITGSSTFKVASGDIEIVLAASPVHELTLASASGNATLDYNGNPVKGWFEFKARAKNGQIVSPFPFDETNTEEKWGQKYDVKTFKMNGDTPKIYIHTASGTAELKK
jgi:DUF4097 and DUF4098 domain-containing protein YvlB